MRALFTQGAAVAEVLIDRFTGQLSVPRADLLIDIGKSINPGIDRGQITGGFIQGMGWVTTEELCYDDKGDLLSHSPTTYKIPAIGDVPQDFRITVLENSDNQQNIHSSKAVGEPPLLLGVSVWAAAKMALSAFSMTSDLGLVAKPPGSLPCTPRFVSKTVFQEMLNLPATNEEILRCITALTLRSAVHEV